MSNLQAAIKVADQLITRLFDHRQFTSGEIDRLTNELASLEENFDKCLKINQNICIISDNNLASIDGQAPTSLTSQINSLCIKAQDSLDLEKTHKKRSEDRDAEFLRAKSETEMAMATAMKEKLKEIQDSLVLEEDQLKRKYREFEENLRKAKQ